MHPTPLGDYRRRHTCANPCFLSTMIVLSSSRFNRYNQICLRPVQIGSHSHQVVWYQNGLWLCKHITSYNHSNKQRENIPHKTFSEIERNFAIWHTTRAHKALGRRWVLIEISFIKWNAFAMDPHCAYATLDCSDARCLIAYTTRESDFLNYCSLRTTCTSCHYEGSKLNCYVINSIKTATVTEYGKEDTVDFIRV